MEEKPFDRPIECSECRRPIAIRYTERIGDATCEWSMCQECPEYQKKIFGTPVLRSYETKEAGFACGDCGTTLDFIKKGNQLGCSNCYEVFQEEILSELIRTERLPIRLSSFTKGMPLHIGKTPQSGVEASPSMKLLALNEALSETIKKENYEQAALLRDKIRELQEKNPELKKEEDNGSGE